MRGVADGDDLEGADNGDVLEVVADRELLEVTAGEVLDHVQYSREVLDQVEKHEGLG